MKRPSLAQRLVLGGVLLAGILWCLAGTVQAQTGRGHPARSGAKAAPAAAGVPGAWAVGGAPYRILIRQRTAPIDPDAGTEVDVPELGSFLAEKGTNYLLTDDAGNPLPVATVWEAPEQHAILLASGLQPDKEYSLYIGGPKGTDWSPRTSLLLETRALSPGRNAFTSNGGIEEAWRGGATEGAKFVGEIFSGGNPFGEQTNFLSHYVGYLLPQDGSRELYTSSSDASFVLLDGRPFLEWPGNHAADATLKTLHAKKLPPTTAPARIDYYQAKDAEGDPAICLGWIKDGQGMTVPADAWLHPGTSELLRCDESKGRPAPAAEIRLKSYLGFGGSLLFEVHGYLLPTDLKGAPVEWRFDDGGVCVGPDCTRIMSGTPAVQRVTVRVGAGADALQSVRRIGFAGQNPPQTDENARGHRHYVELLTKQDPAKLSAAMLGAALPLLIDSGTDEQIAPWAAAWLKTNPPVADPRWLPAELARLRALAQTDPQAALAALRNEGAARQLYARQFDLFEIDLYLYELRTPAAGTRIQQLGFGLGDSPEGRVAAIRLGDFYRLSGDARQSMARYQAAQPADPSNGRRLPAEDQANSLTVKDLIDNRDRQDAAAKLTEWELAHPMAKFTSDYLLLRSRVLTLYGRWREALAELDAFAATHPDSPYQIDVDFYRARVLNELGKKDEARKIWTDLVKNYPRSELAASAQEALAKP